MGSCCAWDDLQWFIMGLWWFLVGLRWIYDGFVMGLWYTLWWFMLYLLSDDLVLELKSWNLSRWRVSKGVVGHSWAELWLCAKILHWLVLLGKITGTSHMNHGTIDGFLLRFSLQLIHWNTFQDGLLRMCPARDDHLGFHFKIFDAAQTFNYP